MGIRDGKMSWGQVVENFMGFRDVKMSWGFRDGEMS